MSIKKFENLGKIMIVTPIFLQSDDILFNLFMIVTYHLIFFLEFKCGPNFIFKAFQIRYSYISDFCIKNLPGLTSIIMKANYVVNKITWQACA